MKDKLKKLWGFVKEHKKEVLVTMGIVGTGITIALMSKGPSSKQPTAKSKTTEFVYKPDIVDLGVGKAEVLSEGTNYKELWVEKLSLDDLGVLGENLAKSIPEIPEHHDKVQVMVNVYGFNETE